MAKIVSEWGFLVVKDSLLLSKDRLQTLIQPD
jgi:hypothetical protein